MNKLITVAIIAGLSGSVFAGAGNVPGDAGNQDGNRVGVSSPRGDGNDDFRDDARRLFLSQSSVTVITGSQPEIGSARSKYNLPFTDAGNH